MQPVASDSRDSPPTPDEKSRWSFPPTVIAFAALVISVAGHVVQYIKTRNDLDTAMLQLELQTSKWSDERTKLRTEITSLRRKEALALEYADELKQVNKDIRVWEDAIFEAEIELSQMKGELQRALNSPDAANHRLTIQAQKDNIEVQRESIQLRKSYLDSSIARRTEIEALIR